MYLFSTIARFIGEEPLQLYDDTIVEYLLTDSRKLIEANKTLFFAISSAHRNANDFIPALYKKGVRAFVVDTDFQNTVLKNLPEANVVRVQNVLHALQQVAIHHRNQFNYPVVGLTGSNGKTIVKEWLWQLLSDQMPVVRSPKSFNSQVGVPLSVWEMKITHRLAIFEAGISKAGEMQKLQPIIRPTIGIFTNIGEAHSAGFNSIEHKIFEKLHLFSNVQQLIYHADDDILFNAMQQFASLHPNIQLFSWGKNKRAHIQIVEELCSENETHLTLLYKGHTSLITIPFTDEASIENALHGWVASMLLGAEMVHVASQLKKLRPLEMRLQLKHARNNCTVINDSYSADLTSLVKALDFLASQHQHHKKTVILSDIAESGKAAGILYEDVARMLKEKNITRFIGVGSELIQHRSLFTDITSVFYQSTSDLLSHLQELNFNNESILLKGARFFEFERISFALEDKTHETLLEVNLSALRHNLNVYRSYLKPGVNIMAMVKAFSYGSGSYEVASLLQHAGVEYLAVAYADEGVHLRQSGITLPIMVMNTEVAALDKIVQYELQPELYSFGILHSFIQFCNQQEIINYPVHLKLDTGMHRLGFENQDMPMLTAILSSAKEIKVTSVFSHLAASDDPQHDTFTLQQASSFIAMSEQIEAAVNRPIMKHLANSAAIHRHPHLQFNIIRLGIGLYGVDADAVIQQQLQHVSTLHTTISQIKKVKQGESVGYSRKSIVATDSVIATVRVGYADGYPRCLSNGRGWMLVNGRVAPVIGNVCMDMTMLDITGIDAEEGDKVIVFGEALPVYLLARQADTIPYEILTGISQRVKRVYYED